MCGNRSEVNSDRGRRRGQREGVEGDKRETNTLHDDGVNNSVKEGGVSTIY